MKEGRGRRKKKEKRKNGVGGREGVGGGGGREEANHDSIERHSVSALLWDRNDRLIFDFQRLANCS